MYVGGVYLGYVSNDKYRVWVPFLTPQDLVRVEASAGDYITLGKKLFQVTHSKKYSVCLHAL